MMGAPLGDLTGDRSFWLTPTGLLRVNNDLIAPNHSSIYLEFLSEVHNVGKNGREEDDQEHGQDKKLAR